MRVKKYVVDSMPDAMQLIRQDLGKNAVIINTKRVRKGGIFGLFGRNKIEVIAATDKENRIGQGSVASKARRPNVSVVAPAVQTVQQHTPSPAVSSHPNDDLIQELKSMKTFMLKVMAEKEENWPRPIQEAIALLKRRGITEALRVEIGSRLLKRYDQQPDCSTSDVLQWLREEVHQYAEAAYHPPEHEAKVRCFVGPTGVGKTTTIAKLAADLMLNQKKKVGFITTDTYRIAAVEQLKTYANILNIPIEVVFSPTDMESAVEKLASCDVILMDTAGRNYLQKQFIDELSRLVPNQTPVQTHLVLSMTSRIDDLEDILDNFRTLPVSSMIVTKLDETNRQGNLLNLITTCKIPVTYLTNGQNVPDDILKVSPEAIADIILGEDAHERPS
jgi:flagellar biosynthesis protein FlhF